MTPDEIRVAQGDRVTFRISTERAVGFRLHGYDVEPGQPIILSLEANITGRFDIEYHEPEHGDGGGYSHGGKRGPVRQAHRGAALGG